VKLIGTTSGGTVLCEMNASEARLLNALGNAFAKLPVYRPDDCVKILNAIDPPDEPTNRSRSKTNHTKRKLV
jgi:hypothetical protein